MAAPDFPRSPAQDREGGVRIRRGIIQATDPTGHTCSVQLEGDGGAMHTGVSMAPAMINADGGGSFWLPQKNTPVWLCYPSSGGAPFIMGGATLPKQTDAVDDQEDPADRRMNRPVLAEGDFVVAMNDTGHIILRRGGVLELGSGAACKRVYLPLDNLIEEFSRSWQSTSAGGLMSLRVRDGETPDVSPVEFKLHVKELESDEYPTIKLELGRVAALSSSSLPQGDVGAIVARFNINDRFKVHVDRDGNYTQVVGGTTHAQFLGARTEHTRGSHTRVVSGADVADSERREAEVTTDDTLLVGRSRSVRVRGALEELVRGPVTRTGSKLKETYAEVSRLVGGDTSEQVAGDAVHAVSGSRVTSSGGDTSTLVAGTSTTTVANSKGADAGYSIYVAGGAFSVHDTLGSVVFSAGGPAQGSAQAKITVKPSGAIILSSSSGAVEIEQNTTGVRIKTPAGSITLDTLGTVQLGPSAGRGNVLTTTSMPVDYVTGVPTVGASSVQAGMLAPLPGPASVQSTFTPDRS